MEVLYNTYFFLGGLILTGNEWICDCDLVWIGEWLRRWLRESFESHSTAIPLVHSMYEEIRRPTCVDPKGSGRSIPLIELYSDVMCHASALSTASGLFTQPLWGAVVFSWLVHLLARHITSPSSGLDFLWPTCFLIQTTKHFNTLVDHSPVTNLGRDSR